MSKASEDISELFAQAQEHHLARRFVEAEELYIQILRWNPKHADSLHLLGTIFAQTGKVTDAVDFLRRAIEIKPDRAPYRVNLGVVLQDLGKYGEARESYECAIFIDKNFPESYYNLGKLYKQMEQPYAALLMYEQLLSLYPDRQDAMVNMGNIFYENGRLDKAIDCFQTASNLVESDFYLTYRSNINLANTYRKQGEDEKAIDAYEKVLRQKTHDGIRIKQALTLPIIYHDKKHIDNVRQRLIGMLDALIEDKLVLQDPALEISSTNFFLAYQAKSNREIQKTTAQVILKSSPLLAFVAKHCITLQPVKEKIKIGFISAYFRHHSIGRLMQGLIAEISKQDFEVVVFTTRGRLDPIAQHIKKNADKLIFFPDETKEAQKIIAAEELDILFYCDLGMDVRTYYLSFARLAPVQCVTWGHPDTTGIPNMDYFISSYLIEPKGAEEHYSEKLYCLKSLPTYYYPVNIPAGRKSKSDFGFALGSTLYLCLQSSIKLHHDVDFIFSEILRHDNKAVIGVVEGAVGDWTVQLQKRWNLSIPDVAHKIKIIPRQDPEDFIKLQATADVVLDTPHFSGGNTSYESFALAKPIVTLDGEFMRGQVTAGMYRMMGLNYCIAKNLSDYIKIALKLGMDSELRTEISNSIKSSNSVLYSNDTVVAEFEAFFKSVVDRA
jgi:predicted O-linked N-acetylglucosamine transferase (SPINDLY family)